MKTSLIVRRDERPAIRDALEAAGVLVFEASDGDREFERLEHSNRERPGLL